ncbi:unnamed protein product [Candida verbasci]|uniref:UBZ4-type domain-containing protein n=1 Tax=Candida verbasci TaxID=1227364 RepID=A0A9W4XM73_9ASCO|nr:unnamed protein product [Candida verbasci]
MSSQSKRKSQSSILSFAQSQTIKQEEVEIKRETIDIQDTPIVPVPCPICQYNIAHLDLAQRNDHVDTCLVRVTFVETEIRTEISEKVESSEVIIKEEFKEKFKSPKAERKSKSPKKERSESREPSSMAKKRKVELKEDKRQRYVNTETKIHDEPKVIKPPTTIQPSKFTKKSIPPLKIMTFPIDKSQNLKYQLSVDAFCFAPSDFIDKYFLTHFHADHYCGISKKWAYERVFTDEDFENRGKYKKIIYCTTITGKLLTLYFSIDEKFIKHLELDTKYRIVSFTDEVVEDGGYICDDITPGIYVTPIIANHCPGAAIFLFESYGLDGNKTTILHCGDFRVNKEMITHPSLRRYNIESKDCLMIDKVYLDTTYMSPTYIFPKQELVCETIANLFYDLKSANLFNKWFGMLTQTRITDFWKPLKKKKKFLILVGSYVIGKEKLAISISKKLNSKIYVSNINNRKNKYDILRTFQDSYLDSVLTDDDIGEGDESEALIHLVPMKIVGQFQEMQNYFNHNKYFEHFERCVGLRPTGWTFENRREEREDFDLPQLCIILEHQTEFSYDKHILTQQSKSKEKSELNKIYTLPYSEHSSFRELAYFIIFLNFKMTIPTVNCEHENSIRKMNDIIELWELVRRVKLNKMKPSDYDFIEDDLLKRFKNITLDNF